MASKLDTILLQIHALEEAVNETVTAAEVKETFRIIRELAQYVQRIQEECIKLLQNRNVDEKQVPQPPFKWDSLRNDTTPFKVPYGPFSD